MTYSVWLPYRRPPAEPATEGPESEGPETHGPALAAVRAGEGRRAAATLRLFCFPHAGGAASLFRRWPSLLPPQVEVCAVQLPGRETRWRDPVPADLSELVEELARALGPLLEPGYALFGASFGGLVAYALARRLREAGRPDPVRLFVAATPAPDRIAAAGPAGAAPPALAAPQVNPELARLAARVLGHDLRLIASYRHTPGPVLRCPLTVFGGTDDPTVTADDLAAWRRHTSADCVLRPLPGGHFVAQESTTRMLGLIRADLAATSTAGGCSATGPAAL